MTGRIIIIAVILMQFFFACPAIADAPVVGSVGKGDMLPALAAADYPVDSAFAINNERISLDFRGVDIRDVLSALAIKMGVDIILVDAQPVEINFKANNITPLQAMELIIEEQGLTYLQNGQIMLVGSPGILQENFFDQMFITRFSLFYVPADKMKELIGSLGVEQVTVTVDTNQNLIWVQGTAQVLKKVRELIYAVDTGDSQLSLEYKTLTLTQIPTERVVELFKDVGIELKRYVQLDNRLLVFDSELFSRWEQIETLVKELDITAAGKRKVFVYQFKNITAGYAAERLSMFNFGDDVKTVTYNYEKFGKELLVICPPNMETAVRSALAGLDTTRQKTRVPVLTVTGTGAHESLNARRNLLSELSGISLANFHISNNLSGDKDKPEYVLWVEETPDNVQLVKDLIGEMGGGSSGSTESED
ncbi:Bacterial type II/III secretion system short domain protein [Sporotomaculum syntrophicum]|uniref:Bacterial type II/III secretion system short domain protein n=1 Tax=Sporotomaculum syntrophicum TaxID=182264 RepID=A0A9D3AXD3_9FIRM|nr:secretin N-terminal domain-containing protein [Sporotomaculum syntrophicum]KAF1086575.1 Bacterial type II/III secretion system short domain protein [Sporotomaculum syntrophicum]